MQNPFYTGMVFCNQIFEIVWSFRCSVKLPCHFLFWYILVREAKHFRVIGWNNEKAKISQRVKIISGVVAWPMTPDSTPVLLTMLPCQHVRDVHRCFRPKLQIAQLTHFLCLGFLFGWLYIILIVGHKQLKKRVKRSFRFIQEPWVHSTQARECCLVVETIVYYEQRIKYHGIMHKKSKKNNTCVSALCVPLLHSKI